jgi:hypothetical protein
MGQHGRVAADADALIRDQGAALAAHALAYVQDPATQRVRVEDYLTALAAVTGEAAIVAAGVFDIEHNDLTPGAAVFGDAINHVLTGDASAVDEVPADSIVGILVRELVPLVVSLEAFGSLERLYAHVAANVAGASWGSVALTVPTDNLPTVLPLRAAFELRGAVDAVQAAAGLTPAQRHQPCAVALAVAVGQVRAAIDLGVAMTLALEVVFGMAKMVPMSHAAMEDPA